MQDTRAASAPSTIAGSLAALVLGFAAFLAVWSTRAGYGFSIDEATYVWVAREARTWFHELGVKGLAGSLADEQLRARWHFLEPPFSQGAARHSNFNLPVSVHVMNLGWLLGRGWLAELDSYRLGNALVYAVGVAFTTFVMVRALGLAWGMAAGLALLLAPRAFGHAHLAATETTMATFALGSLLALVGFDLATHDRQRNRWAVGFAVLFGLSLATKLTNWLTVPPIAAWIVLVRPRGWWRLAVAACPLVPMILYLVTPPLWHDPVTRLFEYLRHASHNPWKIPS